MASIRDKVKSVGDTIRGKLPHRKRTADIKNKESQTFVQLFKELQTDAEGMAKQARKIKQVLKNSADVEDPAKIKVVAKELLQKPGSSFLARHLKMIVTISQVADSLGMSSVCDIMEEAKKKEEQAAQAAKIETPEVPVPRQE